MESPEDDFSRFLELNHATVASASNDDVYDLVMEVVSADPELPSIAARLECLADRRP